MTTNEAGWDSDEDLLSGTGTGAVNAFPGENIDEDALLASDPEDDVLGDDDFLNGDDEFVEIFVEEDDDAEMSVGGGEGDHGEGDHAATEEHEEPNGEEEAPEHGEEQHEPVNNQQETVVIEDEMEENQEVDQEEEEDAQPDDSQVVHEISDEEDESEDEDEDKSRERFKSERTTDNIISLKSNTNREIPDTLEVSIQQEKTIEKFLTGNQRQNRNRGNQRNQRGGARPQGGPGPMRPQQGGRGLFPNPMMGPRGPMHGAGGGYGPLVRPGPRGPMPHHLFPGPPMHRMPMNRPIMDRGSPLDALLQLANNPPTSNIIHINPNYNGGPTPLLGSQQQQQPWGPQSNNHFQNGPISQQPLPPRQIRPHFGSPPPGSQQPQSNRFGMQQQQPRSQAPPPRLPQPPKPPQQPQVKPVPVEPTAEEKELQRKKEERAKRFASSAPITPGIKRQSNEDSEGPTPPKQKKIISLKKSTEEKKTNNDVKAETKPATPPEEKVKSQDDKKKVVRKRISPPKNISANTSATAVKIVTVKTEVTAVDKSSAVKTVQTKTAPAAAAAAKVAPVEKKVAPAAKTAVTPAVAAVNDEKSYEEKLAEQKKLREKLLKQKEEHRKKQAAARKAAAEKVLGKSKTEAPKPVPKQPQSNLQKQTSQPNQKPQNNRVKVSGPVKQQNKQQQNKQQQQQQNRPHMNMQQQQQQQQPPFQPPQMQQPPRRGKVMYVKKEMAAALHGLNLGGAPIRNSQFQQMMQQLPAPQQQFQQQLPGEVPYISQQPPPRQLPPPPQQHQPMNADYNNLGFDPEDQKYPNEYNQDQFGPSPDVSFNASNNFSFNSIKSYDDPMELPIGPDYGTRFTSIVPPAAARRNHDDRAYGDFNTSSFPQQQQTAQKPAFFEDRGFGRPGAPSPPQRPSNRQVIAPRQQQLGPRMQQHGRGRGRGGSGSGSLNRSRGGGRHANVVAVPMVADLGPAGDTVHTPQHIGGNQRTVIVGNQGNNNQRQVIQKAGSAGSMKPATTVRLTGFQANTSTTTLLGLAQQVGLVKSINLMGNSCAEITFAYPEDAEKFANQYKRRMLNLAVVTSELLPPKAPSPPSQYF